MGLAPHAQAIPRPVSWAVNEVRILDQTRLPRLVRVLRCRTPRDVARAIGALAVRGAPLIGIAGAYGTALGAAISRAERPRAVLRDVERAGAMLSASRPTAVNLPVAVERTLAAARAMVTDGWDVAGVRRATLAEAVRIDEEERDACRAIGTFGLRLVPPGARILTHCNTGTLATNWEGTAQAVLTAAFDEGRLAHVWVDETRPLLQGARLTAWELQRRGVPMTLVVDAAAGSLMARGEVDLVVVGADRVAANGDVANKVGTYALAVLARHHRVPFLVAAPASTVDMRAPTGASIPVEERRADEVTGAAGIRVAPRGTPAANPAFDVTPASLVTALVTDRGVIRAPYPAALRAAVGREVPR
jgi:methylthioribose-1-phosphate isomerase